MAPPKRFYKRIKIEIYSDSSDVDDDNIPACKVPKIAIGVEHKHHYQKKLKKLIRKREHHELTDGILMSDQVLKKRKTDQPICPSIVLKDISIWHQGALRTIMLTSFARGRFNLQFLSNILSEQGNTSLTLHSSKSQVNLRYLLCRLASFINNVTQRSQHKMTLPSTMKIRMDLSGRAVWASLIITINLMSLNLSGSIFFVETLQSVIKFLRSLTMTIHSVIELLNKMVIGLKFFRNGVIAMSKSLINLAFFVNNLLMKNQQLVEEFVLLVLDLALLPALGDDDMVKRQEDCSLYLVRSVLNNGNICWQKCSATVYSAMFQQTWNDKLSMHLESGGHVNKNTLLLLTVIQSSVKLPDVSAQSFIQDNLKLILGGLPDNKPDDPFDIQNENAFFLLESVLDNADFIIWHFYSEVRQNLQSVNPVRENFGKLLQDLLTLVGETQWPAAEYLLITLCNFIVENLKEERMPKSSCEFLLRCLGDVFVKLDRLFLSPERHFGGTGVKDSSDSWEIFSVDEQEVEDTENLLFLKAGLLSYLISQCKNNLSSQDRCLFYTAVWFMDNTTQDGEDNRNELDWDQACRLVSPRNVKHVVNRITALRRTSDIQNIFNEVVKLKSLKNEHMTKCLMELVIQLCTSNSTIFVKEESVTAIFSCDCNEVPAHERKAVVRALTAYLFHRPEKIDVYDRVLNSYISHQTTAVRNAAVEGMRMIALKFYNDPKILRKCLLLLKTTGGYEDSAAQYFCNIIWLKPVGPSDEVGLLENKVSLLVNMLALIEDSSSVEEILPSLFRVELEKSERTIRQQIKACGQIVDEIARRCLDGKNSPQNASDYRKVVSSFQLLNHFAKLSPERLVARCFPLWLCLRRLSQATSFNVDLISATTRTMNEILPYIPNEPGALLFHVEKTSYLVANRFQKSAVVPGLNAACSAVNVHGNNDLLQPFYVWCYTHLYFFRTLCGRLRQNWVPSKTRHIQRLTMMLGVLLFNIDLNAPYVYRRVMQKSAVEKSLREVLVYCVIPDEHSVQVALFALGTICLQYRWLIVVDEVKSVYLDALKADAPACILIQVLRNLFEFLRLLLEYTHKTTGQDRKPPLTDLDGNAPVKSAKETVSDIAEVVVATYLEAALARYFHPDKVVRFAVFELLLIVQQHLVLHCDETVHLLAAMSTDPEKQISVRAEKELSFHNKTHSNCISVSSSALLMSKALFRTVSDASDLFRGYYIEDDGKVKARNCVLNSIVLKSKGIRHADFISNILKRFGDKQGTCIFDLLFFADNLVYFEYSKRRDVISLITCIDALAILTAAKKTLRRFRKILRGGLDDEPPPSVHEKTISDVLRTLLLIEMKLFLEERYAIQKMEIEKFKLNQPYRISLQHKNKMIYVSNRTYGFPLTRKESKKLFTPTMSAANIIAGRSLCCGRELSRKTLQQVYRQLKTFAVD